MNSIQSLREQAIQQYEAFEIETRADRKEQHFVQVEKALIQLTGTDPQAIDYYVWGLLYYLSDYPIQKALEKWDIALQVDPQYNMARLYLGQGYFDLKEWSFALQAFQQVDQKRLAVEFPLWRSIKLEELMGVCYYRLGDQVNGQTQLEKVFKAYRENVYADLAHPTEMMLLLEEKGEVALLKKMKEWIEE